MFLTEVFIIQISFAQPLNLFKKKKKKKKGLLDDIVSSRQRWDLVICKVQREIFQQHYPV